ncbi:MAG: acetate kinase [Clostridia bacterium]|nr:acetate kinase [Clostridia bacterium]MBQ1963508.1 acetate kinase [Clostridia bacterium]
MRILVLNAGSSSLKYQLFDMEKESILAKGLCERIGTSGAVTHKPTGKDSVSEEIALPDHGAALQRVLALLTDATHGVISSVNEIDAVGHRVAHGGEQLKESARITESMIAYLESIIPINPLHGPPAIAGIKACLALMPTVPQVAVFDTSFYSEIEDFRYVYPIPYEFYEEDRVRRYGFHGTSHRFVSAELAKALGKPIEELKIVTCHLGNGSSITAVDGGKAIDTSMGFTPQEGICMGTRSGTIDPTVVTYLMKKHGYTPDQMEDILNKKSGLLGVSGLSNDTRDVDAAAKNGNYRAELVLKILANGIKKHIGAYAAEMNGLDALVFTAGIGENQANIREQVCENMEFLGIEIDKERNTNFTRGIPFDISKKGARVATWIIPTNEEYMIAIDTQRLTKTN